MNSLLSAINITSPFTYKVFESKEEIKKCSGTQKVSVVALSAIASIWAKFAAAASTGVVVSSGLAAV